MVHLQKHSELDLNFIENPSQSFSLDSLIKQNEELSAQYRAQIRTLAQREQEQEQLQKNLQVYQEKQCLLEEQILILRHKESSLFDKIQEAQEIKQHFDSLKNLIIQQKAALERHNRYQEKIKTHIKPYIKQLKDIASSTRNEKVKLTELLHTKESLIQKLRSQLELIKQDLNSLKREHEIQIQELKSYLEKERAQWAQVIEDMTLTQKSLQKKATLVDIAHFRQNELENQLIVNQAQSADKIEALQTDNTKLLSELAKLKPENLHLKEALQTSEKKYHLLQNQYDQKQSDFSSLQQQRDILRQQWQEKNDLCQQLQLQLTSLESLNSDLSLKLNEARKGLPTL
jgi:chromosome segregation ATPase